MFKDISLEEELTYSHTITNNQAVWVEWNLNQSYNIDKVGNYRYRPGTNDSKFGTIRSIYDSQDIGTYYTGATDSDTVINAGFDDEDNPQYFISPKKKIGFLYSLDDCFRQNRPRSGVNKLLYLGINGTTTGYSQYIDSLNAFQRTQEATITNAVRETITIANTEQSVITYYANNNFRIGDYVKVSGITPVSFNFANPERIVAATPSTFSVLGTNTQIYSSGGYAQIGYLSTTNVARRPRYYMASRYDDFKYWTSYRTEVEDVIVAPDQPIKKITREYGISQILNTGTNPPAYYIYDAAPFIVYKEKIPTNKIVVKMQTNVGEINNGPFRIGNNINIDDPLYGEQNQTTPKRWAIQILDENNNWKEIISFSESTKRSDGTSIIKSDGQVEIEYGLLIPELFKDSFTFAGEISSLAMRPDIAPNGYAYLYKETDTSKGILFISDGGSWITYDAQYSWKVADTDITKSTRVVTQLSNPLFYVENNEKIYREFQFINGLRIVVDAMNKINSTFDLIELSPRLVSDITNNVSSFNIKKTLADLGTTSMPTGSLIASTGDISIFDEDFVFNENNLFNETTNQGSIVSKYLDSKMKFLFFDIVKNINNYDYYIPIKTLYSEKNPQADSVATILNISLRDYFYYLESKKSPELLLTNVSLSYAITVLLDNIGFTNYSFKRTAADEELIIPFFFVGPNQNVAETLQQLAISSQSAIFFDEYNDLIIMSKNYILPSEEARPTDLVLYGQEKQNGEKTILPNIVNISSQDKLVYNGGEINYTTRYIQKTIGSISQAPYIDEYKTYVYKPVLLWEVAGQEETKTINEASTQASGYSLAAMPLKTNLSQEIPSIQNNQIINNVIDFGESIYWLGNYSGYFYSNGEVIKYDAVEYSVAGVGNIWIKNNQEYQDYFAKLRFNGKMYPTGRVRIYTSIQNGQIKEHGRGQFATEIVSHQAGVDESSTWISNVRGCIQNSRDYLFNTNIKLEYPSNTTNDYAGIAKVINGNTYTSQTYADKSSRNSIIKNFMANVNITEDSVNYYKTALAGSVQTSALIINGPTLPSEIDPSDFVTYTYKTLDKPFKHYGTRMRIIGKIESNTNKSQTPNGEYSIYPANQLSSSDPSKQVSISGGGGGIAFGLNKETNIGYYFEISALSQSDVSSYKNNSNVTSYTILKSPVVQAVNDTVTVTLSTQHDFYVGTSVTISGLVDDNNKSDTKTRLNGEFLVTEISSNRKVFKYKIPSPPVTTATVTAATGDGTKIVYTANNHSFSVGQRVSITGLSNSSFNITGYITAVSNPLVGSDTFTISSTVTGTISAQNGTATYQSLTTISSNGGTVRQIFSNNAVISNIFFYKIKSGSTTADIISKQRSGNTVTLTTLRDHKFVTGEPITVTNVDAALNGSYVITGVTGRTIQYRTSASGNISNTPLDPLGLVTGQNKVGVPEILWRGLTDIIVDDGKFTTQSRLTTAGGTTVYDLSAEYLDIGTTRQFYLYLNNKQIAVVNDTNPLPQYNNLALFVRGSSRAMFENVYALSDNFSENTAKTLQLPISKIFGDDVITESEALKKFAISGIVQNTYLSGISSESDPKYSIYYEEFGTIMREVSYFNIKYDRAYPALYAKLAETLNRVRGYSISGFIAGSYGAEFLIFNAIDKNLNLDDTSGNYLRILGIAFTQNTTRSLKVDDFFQKNSNFTNQLYGEVSNATEYQKIYNDILNSRNKYGSNDFSIEAQYIQTTAAAESMMDWIIKKVINPRKTVGVTTFSTPHIQLGDIIKLNYKSEDGIDVICPETTRFVVYNIEYNKNNQSSSTVIHLAEI